MVRLKLKGMEKVLVQKSNEGEGERKRREEGVKKKRSGVLEIYKGETSREILSPDTV